MPTIPDRIAAWIGIWALRRVFGPPCEIDIRDEFPNNLTCQCINCDAERVMAVMKSILTTHKGDRIDVRED